MYNSKFNIFHFTFCSASTVNKRVYELRDLSEAQTLILQNSFSESPYLTKEIKRKIAARIGVGEKLVVDWFHRERKRTKSGISKTRVSKGEKCFKSKKQYTCIHTCI